MARWTEYCDDLYNYQINPTFDISGQKFNSCGDEGDFNILPEEVEKAIDQLKKGKSPGADNIPAELIQHCGPELITVLTSICQRIWKNKEWPKSWTRSLIIPLPKKGNLRACSNYRTISLISHASKIMLRIILNRLRNKSESLLAEEQAGFRPGRSTVQQIFNLQVLAEKYLHHQSDLHHNFIDFKKAFDHVWHQGLWQVLRDYNFDENLVQVIEALYADSSSAVLLQNRTGVFFNNTVGVRQGCLLSPALFNIFLERIMQEALEGHEPTVSIGGRPICNLRFADDIDLIAGNHNELQELTQRLEKAAGAFGMEVSTEKSKIMVTSKTPTQHPAIKMNNSCLEEVKTFKYLGSTVSSDGKSLSDIKSRIALATAALSNLAVLWSNRRISFRVKFKLYNSLVLSVLLYGSESWTLVAETERRLQAFEMKCFRRLLGISYREHKTNEFVCQQILACVGKYQLLLPTIKRRKFCWFGHVVRNKSLSKTILQGYTEGSRSRGRQRRLWVDNLKDWSGKSVDYLTRLAENRPRWYSAVADFVAPRRSDGHGQQ